ncbi:surface antigen TASV-A8, putative,surface antigen TASV, putative [Trypanosoma cruzi marinkellei]|uniref:Surface antigen TASV-A8, putative,surface antigen TASV, putative n=1 Tax=Trypanosoma cruzi marinkellei TaxID=85056 RepID=K2LZ08_TRYCR|nr:surface antigen TASV-A8, putative,surface antigen TASV, putative [Trypanosoma cruzi marinkellei]
MMLMVTVRRRVACDLLVLALLCCCCLAVCGGTTDSGTDSPASTVKNGWIGEFLCPGADGNLSWRFFGEKDWRKCPNKPGDDDGCALVCDVVGESYKRLEIVGLCTSGSNATGGESRMFFQLGNNTKNCSSTVAAQKKIRRSLMLRNSFSRTCRLEQLLEQRLLTSHRAASAVRRGRQIRHRRRSRLSTQAKAALIQGQAKTWSPAR